MSSIIPILITVVWYSLSAPVIFAQYLSLHTNLGSIEIYVATAGFIVVSAYTTVAWSYIGDQTIDESTYEQSGSIGVAVTGYLLILGVTILAGFPGFVWAWLLPIGANGFESNAWCSSAGVTDRTSTTRTLETETPPVESLQEKYVSGELSEAELEERLEAELDESHLWE